MVGNDHSTVLADGIAVPDGLDPFVEGLRHPCPDLQDEVLVLDAGKVLPGEAIDPDLLGDHLGGGAATAELLHPSGSDASDLQGVLSGRISALVRHGSAAPSARNTSRPRSGGSAPTRPPRRPRGAGRCPGARA